MSAEYDIDCELADMFTRQDWQEYERDYDEDLEPPTERTQERRFPMPDQHEPILGIDIGDELADTIDEKELALNRVLSYINEVNRDAPE